MPRLNVCEPAFTVKPVFRFTNTLMSPEPCAASACDSLGMKCFPTKAMSFSAKWLSISSCVAPSIKRCVRIRRMDGEAASGFALDMEGEFELLIFERELQAREFRR